MNKAKWFKKLENKKVKCLLCPHFCSLEEGKSGICRVRVNHGGELSTEVYGLVSAIHTDPIEKKPLYHFYPGSSIFSIGTVGCNLRCKFCQNCEISQVSVREAAHLHSYLPEEIIEIATGIGRNIGIAYTFNEPAIWFEYVLDVSRLAQQRGLKNVMVTNGYINAGPLGDLLESLDAFSVDLKGFTESFYHRITSSTLKPVINTLEKIRSEGKHLELVNLVIPGLNDDPVIFKNMVGWIAETLGKETVLHLSAYFPRHLATEPQTPVSTLLKFKEIAGRYLTYVYAGNLPSERNDTYCPDCSKLLITRHGYQVDVQGVTSLGKCKNCGFSVFRNF